MTPSTPLRQRMIADMQLQGYAAKTQAGYVCAVKHLAEYYHKSPDLISEEELRQYFLYLKNDKRVSASTYTVVLCGLKFFDEQTLRREWVLLDVVRPAPEQKLPVVLSIDEVSRILACLRQPRYQVCLSTIYACG